MAGQGAPAGRAAAGGMSMELPHHLAETLAALLARTDIDVLEYTTPQGRLVLQRDASGAVRQAPARQPAARETGVIRAPGLGRLLHRHPAQAAPLTAPGERLQAGQMCALLQVGSLLVPVVAPRGGMVVEWLAGEGDLVGYGAALLRLRDE